MRTAAKRQLRARVGARVDDTRRRWLQVERDAGSFGDPELEERVAIARLALLDVADRLEQQHPLPPLAAVELEEAAG